MRLGFIIPACLAILTACNPAHSARPTVTPVPEIVSYERAVFTVQRGSIVSEREMRGTVEPAQQDDLFFRASGYVSRVNVRRGDFVKKDEVMAELQVDDLINQLQQAEIDLQVAQANLDEFIVQHQLEIESAKAEVIICEKRVALSMLAADRSYGDQKIEAQINLDINEQNLIIAEQTLRALTEKSSSYHEQSVKRAELSVERLRELVGEQQIIAPYDCVVMRTFILAGRPVEAFESAIQVGNPSGLVIRSEYDENLVPFLDDQTEVYIYPVRSSQEYLLSNFLPNFQTVTTLNELEALSGAQALYFAYPEQLSNEIGPIGHSVDLKIVLGRKENVLLLPPPAVREYRGRYFVVVEEGDHRRRVEISSIGLKTDELWEIKADLKEGDLVLGP